MPEIKNIWENNLIFESTQIIFLYHIDHKKDDICDSIEKIQSGRKDITSYSHILKKNLWNLVME